MATRGILELTHLPTLHSHPHSHDRLTAAATGFLEKYVQSLGGTASGSAAGGSGSGAAVDDQWVVLEPRTSHTFTKVGDAARVTLEELAANGFDMGGSTRR